MTREEAIARAAKLLNLAKSDNVNEAALAAQRAHELLLRFNITQQIIDDEMNGGSSPNEPIQDFDKAPLDTTNERMTTWKNYLGHVIARANNCRTYTWNHNEIRLVGRASDADTVRYLYMLLRVEIECLAKTQAMGQGKNYSTNFRMGVVDAIQKKLIESKNNVSNQMRQEVSSIATALIKVNTAIAKWEEKDKQTAEAYDEVCEKKGMKTKKLQTNHNQVAREHGKQAGQAIDVSQSNKSIDKSRQRIN
jgi:hypothetical protein